MLRLWRGNHETKRGANRAKRTGSARGRESDDDSRADRSWAKGEFKKELEKLAKDGFLRARVDAELLSLDEEIRLDKRRNHTIEAVIDRLLIKPGIRERLAESVRTALKLTDGAVLVSIVDGEEKLYSEKMACVICDINVPPLEPRSIFLQFSLWRL